MPGVDPAGPTPPTPLPGTDTGDVIHLGARRRRSDRQEPTVGAAYGGSSDTPEEKLAQVVQALYLKRGRTLTDPATAEAYDIALEAMLLIVDGAMIRGGLPEEHHRVLRRMVEDAQRVPDII